jgi:ABC-type Zn2+ transport system substrate-binding protein/surface adhesin
LKFKKKEEEEEEEEEEEKKEEEEEEEKEGEEEEEEERKKEKERKHTFSRNVPRRFKMLWVILHNLLALSIAVFIRIVKQAYAH